MASAGKALVLIGVAIAIIGVLVWLAPEKLRWFGHLPGDIRSEHVWFPIATCLVISVVLTILVNILARLLR